MSTEIDSEISEMNNFIRNTGLEHIPILIFQFIDTDSLEVCRKVSKEWKQFIDNSTSIWKSHLAKARASMKKRQDVFLARYGKKSLEEDLESAFDPDENVWNWNRSSPDYKKWEIKFWKFWTQVFDHFEFEVSDLDVLRDFVLLYNGYDKVPSWIQFETPLNHAAEIGNYYLVNYCVENRYEFRCNIKCLPPLHAACMSGHKDIIRLILTNQDELKIDLNCRANYMYEDVTAFHFICEHGDEELLKLFIDLTRDKGFDYNTQTCQGKTALYMHIGNPKTVALLLKYHDEIDLDLNIVQEHGRTPLQWACVNGFLESVEILLVEAKKKGLYLDLDTAPPHSGDTPIDVATSSTRTYPLCGSNLTGLLRLLIKHTGRGSYFFKNTPSTIASMGRLMDYFDYCEDTGKEIDVERIMVYAIRYAPRLKRLVELLDARGRTLDFKFRDRSGRTLLHLAAGRNTYLESSEAGEAVNFFLEICQKKKIAVKFNVRDHDGNTVFHSAELSALKVLVNYCKQKKLKIDLNVKNKDGKTPFHIACSNRFSGKEKIEYFLSLVNTTYINYNLRDKDGWTIAYTACNACQHRFGIDIVMLLLDHSVTRGIDFNIPDAKGHTILHHLVDFSVKMKNDSFHHDDYFKIIRLLLTSSVSYCININALNKEGKTPFHLACESGTLQVVKIFIECCDPERLSFETQDKNGLTPLHLAVKNDHVVIVKEFLENPTLKKYVNLEIPDINGFTIKDYAKWNQQIAKLFDNFGQESDAESDEESDEESNAISDEEYGAESDEESDAEFDEESDAESDEESDVESDE